MEEPETYRPMAPLTGLVALALSMAAPTGLTALLARTAPFSQDFLAHWPWTVTSDGAWILVCAAVFFPVAFGLALKSLGRNVERRRLVLAYGGLVYLAQCAAMWAVTDSSALWPPILATAVATMAFGAARPGLPHAPDHED